MPTRRFVVARLVGLAALTVSVAGCVGDPEPPAAKLDGFDTGRYVELQLPAWTDRASATYRQEQGIQGDRHGVLQITFRPATFADPRGRFLDGVELSLSKTDGATADLSWATWGLDRCLRPVWYRGSLQTDGFSDNDLAQYADPSLEGAWATGSIGFNPPPAWLAQPGIVAKGHVWTDRDVEKWTDQDLRDTTGPQVGRYAVFAKPVTPSYVDTFWVDTRSEPPSIQGRTFVNSSGDAWPSDFVWTYRGSDWHPFDRPWILDEATASMDGAPIGECSDDPFAPRRDLPMVTVADRGAALRYGLELEFEDAVAALLAGGADPAFDAWREQHPDAFVEGWALNWTGSPHTRATNQSWMIQFTNIHPYSTYASECQPNKPTEILPGIPSLLPEPKAACAETRVQCTQHPDVLSGLDRPFQIIDPMAARTIAAAFWGPPTGEWLVCLGGDTAAPGLAYVVYRLEDGSFWSFDLGNPWPWHGADPYRATEARS